MRFLPNKIVKVEKKEEVKPKEIELLELSDKIPKFEEEYIWVEGYKGTKNNMSCNFQQYELN